MKSTVNKPKTLEAYLALSYPITLYQEEEGGFTVEIKDLPGCISQGETLEEAYAMIADAREGWLTVAFERGLDIPLPSTETGEEYSGKFVLRVPKTLHRQLSEQAERDGSSLNGYVTALLAQQVALAGVLGGIESLSHDIRSLERQVKREAEMRVRFGPDFALPDASLAAYSVQQEIYLGAN